jgi:hypothetical protein
MPRRRPGKVDREDPGCHKHGSAHRLVGGGQGDPGAVRQRKRHAGFNEAIGTFYDVVGSGTSFGASPAGQQIRPSSRIAGPP